MVDACPVDPASWRGGHGFAGFDATGDSGFDATGGLGFDATVDDRSVCYPFFAWHGGSGFVTHSPVDDRSAWLGGSGFDAHSSPENRSVDYLSSAQHGGSGFDAHSVDNRFVDYPSSAWRPGWHGHSGFDASSSVNDGYLSNILCLLGFVVGVLAVLALMPLPLWTIAVSIILHLLGVSTTAQVGC